MIRVALSDRVISVVSAGCVFAVGGQESHRKATFRSSAPGMARRSGRGPSSAARHRARAAPRSTRRFAPNDSAWLLPTPSSASDRRQRTRLPRARARPRTQAGAGAPSRHPTSQSLMSQAGASPGWRTDKQRRLEELASKTSPIAPRSTASAHPHVRHSTRAPRVRIAVSPHPLGRHRPNAPRNRCPDRDFGEGRPFHLSCSMAANSRRPSYGTGTSRAV